MKSIMFLLLLCALLIAAHADTATHIYECIINGEHVFSDHMCADNAIERNVVVANRMDPVKVRATPATHDTKRARSSRAHNVQDTRHQRCAKIQQSRGALVDQMRAGFTARQDEKLHDRVRKLDSEYYELRCSGVQ